MKILVTGGCGYIGAHTEVSLIQQGYQVICVDNNIRSSNYLLQGIEKITGTWVKNYKVDLCNYDDTYAIFNENPDITGVIHFAALKSVAESVQYPLWYFDNNLNSLVNILKCVQEFKVPQFVFSSSCTVYGNPLQTPVTEQTPWQKAESPYGATKQMGETIIENFAKINKVNCTILRYFNPAGAHPTGHIGEISWEKPIYLTPNLTWCALGKIPELKVFGTSYPTRDGSCVRDFIHVCDLADAHVLALQKGLDLNQSIIIYNLGTGHGVTVKECITAFEEANKIKLPVQYVDARAGDVVATYSDNSLAAKQLGWQPKYSLHQIMETALVFEKNYWANAEKMTDNNYKLN
jgi:UDP-glucose 4-epimerase